MQIANLKISSDSKARAGTLVSDHGKIPTPVFMPVGTAGSVKALAPRDLTEAQAAIILGNTYHLLLRPGTQIIEAAGGLHNFMSWKGAMLTDSGGYQVFSLSELNRISEEGVTFQSPLDGSRYQLTPETSIDIQRSLGADIIMAFDECTPHPVSEEGARDSMDRTHRWEKRSVDHFRKGSSRYDHDQHLFGIVQGSIYPELRRQSAARITAMEFDGYAIGGLSVGESKDDMYTITDVVTDELPVDQPRYLMGVGKPEDLVTAVGLGVDMFDCVLPTRNARHGVLYTWKGQLSVKAGREKERFEPVDENCSCYCCQNFDRAYLRHLLHAGEILGMQLASIHNTHFYQELMRRMRKRILEDKFKQFQFEFFQNYRLDQDE